MKKQFTFKVKAMLERGAIRSVIVIAKDLDGAMETAEKVFESQNDPMDSVISVSRRSVIIELDKEI